MTATVNRLLQRQIMPVDRELDAIALYVDLEEIKLDASKYEIGGDKSAKDLNNAAIRQSTSTGRTVHPDQIVSRTGFAVPAGEKVSFGSYFNAFPASYWRRWTVVTDVTLTVEVSGAGASVVVNKSTADGRSQKVDAATVEGESATLTFDLSLKPFVDGGWYWYDVVAGASDVVVTSAEWTAQVPADRAEHGTVDVAITTMNRPDFCAKLLSQFGTAELLPYLDTVFVMEQGTQLVADSEFFAEAEKGLEGKLRVIEQGNLGGSGGYARGQLESVRKGTSTYTLLMDDDVVCEPEGVIRAVTFGDLCRRPTLVGGHMFSLYAKSRLHSFGEIVQPWRFWWQTPLDGYSDWDLSARNIRSSRWLHKRVDVDFNGWFMCLIPREVIAEIGLSLPLFIKWDDSEYGLRAKEAGYPTVTFPGAAVWHVPWGDKNDAVDWQAYFHLRNRFIAALLHSPYPKGGRMIRESLNHQIAHLVSMQYSTAELRLMALEDVLAGPEALHGMLATKLGDVNAFRKQFTDAQLHTDRDDFPPVRRTKPPRKGKDVVEVPGRLSSLISAGVAPLRHAVKQPREMSRSFPEAEIRAMDAKWWKLASYDSAIVSMNDGSSSALYKRDLGAFRELMKRTLAIHEQYRREWPELAQRYRAALKDITSLEAWDETFRPWTGEENETAESGEDAMTEPITAEPEQRTYTPVEGELAPPSANQGLLEVFRRRYLLRLLVKRELSARYEGSFLGFVWSYINPLSQFFIYWFVMGKIMGNHKSIPDYPIHIFSALVVVHFFTETFGAGTRSIVRNKSLVNKMAMPREMFPVAAMLVSLAHVGPQLVILLFVCLLSGWTPEPMTMIALLLALAIAMVLGTALALLFSVANVFFRDFGSFVGILTNYVRFGVPMIYTYEMIHDNLSPIAQTIYMANPIADAVLLKQRAFWVPSVNDPKMRAQLLMPEHQMGHALLALLSCVVLLVIAQLVFNKFEKKIPERL